MARKEKVIFDTNFLLEKRMKYFFGKQDQLTRFSEVADIIVPDMVIRELEERYKRDFFEKKESFMNDLLSNVLNHNVSDIDIEGKITELKEEIDIDYEVIYLHNYSVLQDIKEMALTKTLPFKNLPNHDSGFKDAYIYFTIKEYLRNITDRRVFFVTNDDDFKKSFDTLSKVIPISDYNDFKQHSITTRFNDGYLLDKISEYISAKIEDISIIDYWSNIYDNEVVLVQVENEDTSKWVVEVDSGEINEVIRFETYKPLVESIVSSGAYTTTHSATSELFKYTSFLSDDDILSLFEALCENDQVTGAYGYGVKRFYNHLYSYKKDILPTDLRQKVDAIVKLEK